MFWKHEKEEEKEEKPLVPAPGTFVYQCKRLEPGLRLLAPIPKYPQPPWYTAYFILRNPDSLSETGQYQRYDFKTGLENFCTLIRLRKNNHQELYKEPDGSYDQQIQQAVKDFRIIFAFGKEEKRYHLKDLKKEVEAAHEAIWYVRELEFLRSKIKIRIKESKEKEELERWEKALAAEQNNLLKKEEEVAPGLFVYHTEMLQPGRKLLAPLPSNPKPPWYSASFEFRELTSSRRPDREYLDFTPGLAKLFSLIQEIGKLTRGTKEYDTRAQQIKGYISSFEIQLEVHNDTERFQLDDLASRLTATQTETGSHSVSMLLSKVRDKQAECKKSKKEELRDWEQELLNEQWQLREDLSTRLKNPPEAHSANTEQCSNLPANRPANTKADPIYAAARPDTEEDSIPPAARPANTEEDPIDASACLEWKTAALETKPEPYLNWRPNRFAPSLSSLLKELKEVERV
ncbi:MAG: hypothetical protein Q9220_001846 [cf. Caloplaca sp. 1 TL-2023]